jgi:hypothetical protein
MYDDPAVNKFSLNDTLPTGFNLIANSESIKIGSGSATKAGLALNPMIFTYDNSAEDLTNKTVVVKYQIKVPNNDYPTGETVTANEATLNVAVTNLGPPGNGVYTFTTANTAPIKVPPLFYVDLVIDNVQIYGSPDIKSNATPTPDLVPGSPNYADKAIWIGEDAQLIPKVYLTVGGKAITSFVNGTNDAWDYVLPIYDVAPLWAVYYNLDYYTPVWTATPIVDTAGYTPTDGTRGITGGTAALPFGQGVFATIPVQPADIGLYKYTFTARMPYSPNDYYTATAVARILEVKNSRLIIRTVWDDQAYKLAATRDELDFADVKVTYGGNGNKGNDFRIASEINDSSWFGSVTSSPYTPFDYEKRYEKVREAKTYKVELTDVYLPYGYNVVDIVYQDGTITTLDEKGRYVITIIVTTKMLPFYRACACAQSQ